MIVKCQYFDKKAKPMTNLGDLRLNRLELIHSLFSLRGTYPNLFSSYVHFIHNAMDILINFKNLGGVLAIKPLPADSYDGFKRNSDFYGAALTVLISRKKYGNSFTIPITQQMLSIPGGTRCDFVAIDRANNYSLFESKSSITNVNKKVHLAKAIKQLNSMGPINAFGSTPTRFTKKIAVLTSFRQNNVRAGHIGTKCDIFDPEEEGNNVLTINLNDELKRYYSFFQKKEFNNEEVLLFDGKKILCSKIIINYQFEFTVGLLEDIYKIINSEEKQKDILKSIMQSTIDDDTHIDDGILFSDGIFLSSKYLNNQ